MRTRVAEQDLFALAVHLYQVLAQVLQVGEVHDVSAHAGASLAVFEDFATDYEFIVAVDAHVFENLLDLRLVADVENTLDDGLFFAGADHRSLRLVAAYHAERLEEYGLAGAGFTGNGGKALVERDICVRNKRERIYGKLL